MMKPWMTIGAVALLTASVASAQPAPPFGGPPGGPHFGGPPGPPGGGPPGEGPQFGGPPGPGGPSGMGPPPPPPTKGAVFRIGDGSRRVFIKCADDDSTKTCMDAVGPLLDKLLSSK